MTRNYDPLNEPDISIRLGQCEECEDSPRCLDIYYKDDLVYSTDMRPEEYEDLDQKIDDCMYMLEEYLKENKGK